MEFSYFKTKKRNAFIVLSIFIVIISVYYSSIWRILTFSLKYLPGFHINEDTIRNTVKIKIVLCIQYKFNKLYLNLYIVSLKK